ncbi:MAG: protein kinase, partial [bacterium]|nr:protein kinase [bacterium]
MVDKQQQNVENPSKASKTPSKGMGWGTEPGVFPGDTVSETFPDNTRSLENGQKSRADLPTETEKHGIEPLSTQTSSHPDSFFSSQQTSWALGEIIEEKYEVNELVGKGGMGSVYKIRHREWDIDLAVKVPLANLVEHEILKRRFAIEAQTWVNLGLHPNIVQCWYVREIGGIPCVFMDYLEGGSLKDWIQKGLVGPGEWETILDIILQACYGLEYAHANGVIAHRDIKPGNLLLNENGHLYVTDFGIVKQSRLEEMKEEEDIFFPQADSQAASTLTGSDLGTPEYSAPEQWGKASNADARADIYALGGILFELCCGRRPFDESREQVPASVLIGRHLFATVPDPCSINETIPDNLATLTTQCLAKEPNERPSTVTALRRQLVNIFKEICGKDYWRELPKPVELRSSTLNNRAVSLLDLGRQQEAFTALEEALQFDPHHPESVYNTALLQWRNEKIADDEVVKRLKEAKQASWYAGLYLGLIQLERAEADEAEKEFLEVLRFEEPTRNGLVWRALGDAHMAQEKFREALAAYQKAAELLPQDTSLLERIDLAHNRTRQREGQTFFPWPRCLQTLGGYDKELTSAALTTDGRFALLGDRETIRFWDLHTGRFLWTFTWSEQALWTFRGFAGSRTSAAVTPDGAFALSAGSYESNVRLWNLKTGKCVRIFKGHTEEVRALAVTPDGSCLVSGGADTNIRLWKIETGHCLRVFRGHDSPVNALALSADGNVLLSGSEREIRVWELNTGKYLRRCRELKDEVNALTITPNGKIALSAQRDNTICLSSVNSGRILQKLAGHSDKVNAVAVTPDGKLAVSGSSDKTLRVWDLSNGRCRA